MRDWIIKHWAYSYDSKVFGTARRHLRVVNTLMVLFCAAGLYNLLTPGFDFWQIVVFLPFIVIFFGGSKLFLGGKPEFDELDWEQQFQVLGKQSFAQRQEDGTEELFSQLRQRHADKYLGSEKFVEAFRGLFPLLVILLSLIIYFVFGFNEAGFTDQRFF